MTRQNGSYRGIPQQGMFDAASARDDFGYPFGTHHNGRWEVTGALNQVVTAAGGESVRIYRDRPKSYDDMFRASVARGASQEAVVCGDRRVSYSELDLRVERTAYGLVQAGLTPGARMVIMLDNRLEYLVAVLACIRAGGIAVPLGTRLGPSEVDYVIGDATPVFAVTAATWLPKFPADDRLRRIFVVDDSAGSGDHFETLSRSEPAMLPALAGDDIMMIVYTSGTTGKPKGACLTHSNFVHTCLHYIYALAIDRPQRSLLTIPATHIAGFGPLASVTLASGGTIVMMREFKAQSVLELIQCEKISYAV